MMADMPENLSDMCLVLTTESDRESGDLLAAELIAARAAACVSMYPITSTYRWDGEVEVAHEVQLVIKTDENHVAAVLGLLRTHHSYDVPEVVVLRAEAGASYKAWMGSELA